MHATTTAASPAKKSVLVKQKLATATAAPSMSQNNNNNSHKNNKNTLTTTITTTATSIKSSSGTNPDADCSSEIEEISKKISEHADAIYRTWKSRGLAPTELLVAGSVAAVSPGEDGLKVANSTEISGLQRMVSNFVIKDKEQRGVVVTGGGDLTAGATTTLATKTKSLSAKSKSLNAEAAASPSKSPGADGNVVSMKRSTAKSTTLAKPAAQSRIATTTTPANTKTATATAPTTTLLKSTINDAVDGGLSLRKKSSSRSISGAGKLSTLGGSSTANNNACEKNVASAVGGDTLDRALNVELNGLGGLGLQLDLNNLTQLQTQNLRKIKELLQQESVEKSEQADKVAPKSPEHAASSSLSPSTPVTKTKGKTKTLSATKTSVEDASGKSRILTTSDNNNTSQIAKKQTKSALVVGGGGEVVGADNGLSSSVVASLIADKNSVNRRSPTTLEQTLITTTTAAAPAIATAAAASATKVPKTFGATPQVQQQQTQQPLQSDQTKATIGAKSSSGSSSGSRVTKTIASASSAALLNHIAADPCETIGSTNSKSSSHTRTPTPARSTVTATATTTPSKTTNANAKQEKRDRDATAARSSGAGPDPPPHQNNPMEVGRSNMPAAPTKSKASAMRPLTNGQDKNLGRPILTRGSVAERVLMFEKCPDVRNSFLNIKRPDPANAAPKSLLKVKLHSTPPTPQEHTSLQREYRSTKSVYIPRFYFPHGKPQPTIALERTLRGILSAFDSFPNNQVTKDELPRILKLCGLPFYWRMPVMVFCQQSNSGLVERQRFVEFWKQMNVYCHEAASRFVYILSRGQRFRSYILPEDLAPLVQDVVDTHPGLAFLKEATEFHSRYVHTVIGRIFYSVNRSWSGKITIAELKNSDLLEIITMLEEEDDINQIMAFFSYEHFYVIYCKFWELDKDHDLLINQDDLARHSDHALSTRIVERIFSGCVTRSDNKKSPDDEPKMSYTDFVWFLLSEEDKRTPTAIEYWFRCMDIDGDGMLSMYELEYFYEEQQQRMESIGIETLPFEDCLCQMLDMIKPQRRDFITLGDLKRCKMTHVFFDTFFNLEKYLDHEQRDPFASQRDEYASDWDRFAAQEYELLITEEND